MSQDALEPGGWWWPSDELWRAVEFMQIPPRKLLFFSCLHLPDLAILNCYSICQRSQIQPGTSVTSPWGKASDVLHRGLPVPHKAELMTGTSYHLNSVILQAVNTSAASKNRWMFFWDAHGCAVSNATVCSQHMPQEIQRCDRGGSDLRSRMCF